MVTRESPWSGTSRQVHTHFPDTGTTKHSVSALLDFVGDVSQTSDDNCCSESGSSASCSNWYRPSVSTPLRAKTVTPASSVSSVSGSGSSLSMSSRSGQSVLKVSQMWNGKLDFGRTCTERQQLRCFIVWFKNQVFKNLVLEVSYTLGTKVWPVIGGLR